MDITLIHNPSAGSGELGKGPLRDALRAAGHQVRYASVKKGGWKSALQHPGDLVLVVGGDGTVGKVARRLVYRRIPLAIIPSGTANNFARTLGISGRWEELVAGLEHLAPAEVDIGIAAGEWGARIFLEGAGFGPIPTAISAAHGEPDGGGGHDSPEAELRRDVERVLAILRGAPVREVRVEVDGADHSCEAVLVAVLNTGTVGPHLRLAPDCAPHDGHLSVVVAREEHRRALVHHLEERIAGRNAGLDLPTHRGRTASVRWPGPLLHVDGLLLKGHGETVDTFFTCSPRALRVMLPAQR